MNQRSPRRTGRILPALLLLSGAALPAGAEVVHHWRFEEDAFLEDTVGGVFLDDSSAFGQQFVALEPGSTELGSAFPTSLEEIGPNQGAMISRSSAKGFFADETTLVEDDYTIEMFTSIDSLAGNPLGIVLAAQYTDCCSPPQFSWTFMIRTDGLYGSEHGELIAWSSNGSQFQFLQSDFVLQEGIDYYLSGALDMDRREYVFRIKDLANDSPMQTSTARQTIGSLNQSERFQAGGGSGWSLDGLVDEIRFSTHFLSDEELLINQIPPNLEGDFDLDGELTGGDLDLLYDAIVDPNPDLQFDLTSDEQVNLDDQRRWVKELKQTWFGDSNLDGEFNSGDLINVLQAGEYEDGQPMNSTWSSGDWNADREFDATDLVRALQDGGFAQGPVRAVSAVPEPASLPALVAGLLALLINRRILAFGGPRRRD